MKKTRIRNVHPCDETAQVVTVEGGSEGFSHRRKPCPECPWRKDSPIGSFPAEAYRHSASTAYDMAQNTFACHMTGKDKPAVCAGFLLSGATHNMSVRLAMIMKGYDPRKVRGKKLVYKSYREMAEANGVDADDPALKLCRDR